MRIGLRALSWALAAFAVVGAANAAQRTFVASYGSDAWPCTLAQPCRGFQAAIDAVSPGGEVVALDSAGYGAMSISKAVSVIVPPGVHAGLSPTTGIPIPGYPGQFTVVLIDIADTDVVVLRGLNINHQGNLTGVQLRGLAKLCVNAGDGTLRTAINQNVVLAFIPLGQLPQVYTALGELGLAAGGANEIDDVITCPGAYTCNLGITKTMNLGAALQDAVRQYDDPRVRRLTIKASGCPNACGHHCDA